MEMTALPGAGAFPGIAGMPSGEEDPEEGDEPLLLWSLSCCEKGSLLANRLKEASWPSCTVVVPEARAAMASQVYLQQYYDERAGHRANHARRASGAGAADIRFAEAFQRVLPQVVSSL